MKKYRFLSGNKSAQAMVEFAIALPVLLLLLYGILEAGRLLFMYSTVVTASRQAARYGSATGEGNGGVPRFQDCKGIRAAANAAGYLGPFDAISIKYDTGPGTTQTPICPTGVDADTSFNVDKVKGNRTRLVVQVTEQFNPLVRLVPFFQRNIVASSARTILYSVAIVVEQEQQEWYKEPTITTITSDTPDPSEILQKVRVTATVTGGSPTGNVIFTGADSNCTAPLSGGTASCDMIFNTAGSKVITAFYEGDTDHLASSDTEDHEVTLINTVTTILSDLPDASVKDKPFVVIVQVLNVNGGTPIPAGTVDIDGGGNVRCTIPLSNGVGNCELTYNNLGLKTLTATYNGDATHLTSNDTEDHMVIEGTPTPTMTPTVTLIPTATIPPTATMTPTPSATPTIIPTPVPSCNRVAHGSITRSNNTMNMTITNPYPFPIVMNNVTVTWNDDKGHQTGSDKTLNLESMFIGGVSIWTGNVADVSYYTIPTTAIIPAGSTITISFYFHQTYDNPDGTEKVYINLLTPGCENNPIDSSK